MLKIKYIYLLLALSAVLALTANDLHADGNIRYIDSNKERMVSAEKPVNKAVLASCPAVLKEAEPSRVVMQVIDNTFHKWKEFDLGNGKGICIVMEKPEYRRLTAKEAQDLLDASASWTDHIPPATEQQILSNIPDFPPAMPYYKPQEEAVFPGAVIGEDERVRVSYEDCTSYPFNTIGQIWTFTQVDDTTYGQGGSGFLIGPHTILSNAHVIYHHERGLATNIRFAPGQYSLTKQPYGATYADSWEVDPEYILKWDEQENNKYSSSLGPYDIGAIFINNPFPFDTYMPLEFNYSPSKQSSAEIKGDILQATSDQHNTINSLQIGDRVVDPSWEWKHLTGNAYSGTGVTKPVTWIVVAKDHYGAGSGVTLLAEELIGRYVFDNSTDRGSSWGGCNHWGSSGTTDATRGLRPWLNSSGNHSGEGFYRAFSADFQDAVVQVTIPNKEWQAGDAYTTQDRIFIPSNTELGDTEHNNTYEISTVYPFFSGASNADRIAQLGGVNSAYLTRSPGTSGGQHVHLVATTGGFHGNAAYRDSHGVRPALNLKPETCVSETKNADGAYELFTSTPDPEPVPDPDPEPDPEPEPDPNSFPFPVKTAGYPAMHPGVNKGNTAQWLATGEAVEYYSPYSSSNTTPRLIKHTADATGGQSGSPIWTKNPTTGVRRVIALHAFGCFFGISNGGPRLVSENEEMIEQWMNWEPDEPLIDIDLASLSISEGYLSPSFLPDITSYQVDVGYNVNTIEVTAKLSNPTGTGMTIDGKPVYSGEAKMINLGAPGSTTQTTITVTANDHSTQKMYSIGINRAEEGLTILPDQHGVEIDQMWRINFNREFSKDEVEDIYIDEVMLFNTMTDGSTKFISVEMEWLPEEKQAIVTPKDYYEPGQTYHLKMVLNNGKSYRLKFTVAAE